MLSYILLYFLSQVLFVINNIEVALKLKRENSNCFDGVMIRGLALSAVDCEFEHRSSQIKG